MLKYKVFLLPIFLLSLFIIAGLPSIYANNNALLPDFSQIDAYVRSEMQRAAIPGLAYGVVTKDRVIHLMAFGVADTTGRPVTPQTPFVIGSVGKTFTALAITQLESAGKLDIDAPVRRYIPWFRTADSQNVIPDPAGTITIRQLRIHTSGLSRADGMKAIFYDERSTLKDLVRKIETVRLNRPVGLKEEYSNLNFLVLGLVVEQVSGQTIEAYVQEHILAPLEMRHTYLSEGPAIKDGLATGYHIWYGFPIPMHAPFPLGAVAQGYAISTAEDLAHYMIPYINHGEYQGISLTGRTAQADQTNGRFWYDIHWQPRYEQGEIAMGQSGGTQNFNAYLEETFSAQAEDYGVVVLLNTRPDYWAETVTAQSISEGIVAQLYGHSPQPSGGLLRYEWYGAHVLIDLVLVGLIAYTVSAVLRLIRWLRTSQRSIPGSILYTGLDLLVGITAIALPPVYFHFSWLDPFLSYIEIGIVVIPAGLILCAASLTRVVVLLIKPGKQTTHQAARIPSRSVG